MKTLVWSPLPFKLCRGLTLLWIMLSTLTAYCEEAINRSALEKAMLANPVDITFVDSTDADPIINKPFSDSRTTPHSTDSTTRPPIKIVNDTVSSLNLSSSSYQQPVTVYQSRITDNAEIFLSQFFQRFDFNHNLIAQDITFYQSLFNDAFVFSFNRVNSRSEISSTHFHGEANFYNNRFHNVLHLSEIYYH